MVYEDDDKMNNTKSLVIVQLDEKRYALDLSAVERVIRAVDLTSLPNAPDIVLGLINVSGCVIPVINVRRRFHLPERNIDLNDQMIIARTKRRVVALVVDSVLEVAEYSENAITASEKIVPGLEYVEGVLLLEKNLILIHNLDQFLSLEEENLLTDTLSCME